MSFDTLNNGIWDLFLILNLDALGSGEVNIHYFLTTKQFEEALMKEQQKISVDKPLTDEDCKFLERICCPALPNQSIVDLSPFDTEKIQGYAIVLKQIDGKNLTTSCLNAL